MDGEYINTILGLTLDIDDICKCIDKMGLYVKDIKDNGKKVEVEAPPTRSDIL